MSKPDLFKEIIDPKTGRSSLTTLEPKVIMECHSHYWEITGNRELTCKNCKIKSFWNIAYYDLKDGKLIPKRDKNVAS